MATESNAVETVPAGPAAQPEAPPREPMNELVVLLVIPLFLIVAVAWIRAEFRHRKPRL